MKKLAPDDLSVALAEARSAKPALDKATDNLNVLLLQAEKAIAELKLGVSAHVDIYPDDQERDDTFVWLSFEKEDKEWHLKIIQGDWDYRDDSVSYRSSIRITNASRADRLRAVTYMPALVQAMTHELKKETNVVLAATSHLESFIDKLTANEFDSLFPSADGGKS